jgi:signal transduction histidine kinase
MRRPAALTAGLLAVLCLVAAIDVTLAYTVGRQMALFYVSEIGAALVWAAVGTLALVMQPNRPVGRMMQVFGLVLLVDAPAGFVMTSTDTWVAVDLVVARAVQPFQTALFGHLFLSYPEGRLHRKSERVFIFTAYLYAAVVSVADTVATVDQVTEREWKEAIPAAGIAGGGSSLPLNAGWWVLTVAYLILLIGKVRRATRRERRLLAYPMGGGAVLIVLFLAITGLTVAGGTSSMTNLLATILAYLGLLIMPGAFLLALVRERLSYGSVAEFVRTIECAPIGRLQTGLRKALGDPTLEVAFPRADEYISESGVVVPFPNGDGRAVLPVGGDPPIAVVLHDASLTDQPKLLTAASAATRLALENARLHALVHEQLTEVRASRRRIIEAGVDERRRLERDLHDGAQQRMLAVGIALQLLKQHLDHAHPAVTEMLDEAQRELQTAIDELRELARGIHPAVLTEQGLSAAVRALAKRSPVPVTVDDALPHRLQPPVEAAAYFAVSEALSNVVKHSGASTARIQLGMVEDWLRIEVVDDGTGGATPDRGSGLRGIADRAAAFDGTLSVADALPTGTRLVVELRCD